MVFKGEVHVVVCVGYEVCDISFGFLILLAVLSMASWVGMDVYRDTTLRLQGYGNDLLVLSSLSCIHLMRSKLFSRCVRGHSLPWVLGFWQVTMRCVVWVL